jgi:queuine tRNA-ribosyltransferase
MKCKEPLGPRLLSVHNLHHYLELMRAARAAIEAGRYGPFMRETLAAIDRHEHDASGRPPGRRTVPAPLASSTPAAPGARFEIVATSSGEPSVRDAEAGEVMHPVIGAAVESERLYVAQSRLAARLLETGPGPLVLFDVGLGAAGNALAAIRAARGAPPGSRPLTVVSFERELGALALACSDDGARRLGWSAGETAAARALLHMGRHEEPGLTWELRLGEALDRLDAEPLRADVIFWDPFSPKVNGELWTTGAFARLASRCAPGATLFTYSTATAVRSALLLAGFAVGHGDASGPKEETTAAALPPAHPARPLDARWLARLGRSSAPFPADAPADALGRIAASAQFR